MGNISNSDKNKRIAQNTIIMYLRMLVMLIVSLFTARIVFNTLGVESYGTYNLVGGIIVFFTFINSGLSNATNRFVTAEIGKGDNQRIKHVFNICISAHIIIALVVLILAETIGLWFVNHKLNIPPELMRGANWAYQLSVISAILGIIQSPFGATIVAYERMGVYAMFTITDVIFKLFVIYAVQTIEGDKLIIYSSLLFGVSIVNMIMYRVYTFIKIPTCRLQIVRDPKLLKEVFSFTSWSLLGQGAVVCANQGVSVLINLFFNVAVNAAMGISGTIASVVNGFVLNFQVAFNPQIIKSYNSGELDYLKSLIIRASKLSSYLIIIFFVPLLFLMPDVLTLWLDDYPQYTVEFCLLTLVCIYLESIGAPLWMMVYAQSDIKRYQIIISSVYSLSFFCAWGALAFGASPYSVIAVRAVVFLVLLFVRLYYVKILFSGFSVRTWIVDVFVKGIVIILLSALVTSFAAKIIEFPLFVYIVCVTMVSLLCTVSLIYFYGMNVGERSFINCTVGKFISRTA